MEHGDDRATFGGVISKLISLILLCDDTPSDKIFQMLYSSADCGSCKI